MESASLQLPLCDALARGRLSIAEMCGLEPEELDALCELAAEKLDLGLIEEAVRLLAGLIALYPFEAKYWRVYAIALHQLDAIPQATQACIAALNLDPSSESAQSHLAQLKSLQPQASEPSDKPRDAQSFSLKDGTPLPLEPSSFPAPSEAKEQELEPTLVTASPQPSAEVTEVFVTPSPPPREVTRTAIIRRRPSRRVPQAKMMTK